MAGSGDDFFNTRFDRRLNLKDLEDGKLLNGDFGTSFTPPQGFDMAKFHRGRVFFRDHLFSCSTVMFFSLVLGMSIPEFLEALVFTKASDTPEKAFNRYLLTYHHVALWHYGNVWEEDSAAHKSIQDIRNIHKTVREKMEAACKDKDRLFLSQYDMGVVQSGFMGAIIMYPGDFGINCSLRDLGDYVYFWYGIGHALGIKHEYNICAHGLTQALTFCKQIEQELVGKNLTSPPPEFEKMTNAVITAFQLGRGSWSILTFPVISSLSLVGNKPARLSIGDTVRYLIWKLLFLSVKHFSFIRLFLGQRMENLFKLVFTEA